MGPGNTIFVECRPFKTPYINLNICDMCFVPIKSSNRLSNDVVAGEAGERANGGLVSLKFSAFID